MKGMLTIFIVPLLSFSQLFTIDTDYMEIYNLSSVNNFSENTYVNTLENVNMSYQIIVDSMPPSWDFQHCFPECHPINTYEIDPISFPSDSSVFLKGHFYPNNVAGEGLLIMELEANHGLYVDTVTWRGTAMEETNLKEHLNTSSEIRCITNLAGQHVINLNSEDIIIVTYESGERKTYYILK